MIIDLDSCAKFGGSLEKLGTFDWEDPDAFKSSKTNDAFGLKLLMEKVKVGEGGWCEFEVARQILLRLPVPTEGTLEVWIAILVECREGVR